MDLRSLSWLIFWCPERGVGPPRRRTEQKTGVSPQDVGVPDRVNDTRRGGQNGLAGAYSAGLMGRVSWRGSVTRRNTGRNIAFHSRWSP